MSNCVQDSVKRFEEEEIFEQDVRAVLRMLRPHRRERLQGWKEYRTGGQRFRVTVSWDEDFELHPQPLRIPAMVDVLESLLVGSAERGDELQPAEEFELYRDVVRQLYRRLDELQASFE